MTGRFYHGPDKIPFRVLQDGVLERAPVSPFHGIVSRGLFNKLVSAGIPADVWNTYAPCLEPGAAYDESDVEVVRLRAFADECKVLSFAQSAMCAYLYVERYCPPRGQAVDQCEFWNIKEGHTSSVWKVTAPAGNHATEDVFVLNVARDREGGRELRATGDKMTAIGSQFPGINMARVVHVGTVSLRMGDSVEDVVVSRNEWVPGASEIHAPVGSGVTHAKFVLVDSFLTRPERPAHIDAIRGRELLVDEWQRAKADIDTFLLLARTVCPVQIDINEGDVVWNGSGAVVVAIG